MRLSSRTHQTLFAPLIACALLCGTHAQDSKGRGAQTGKGRDATTTTRGIDKSDAGQDARKDAKQDARKDERQDARKRSDAGGARRRREVVEAVAALREAADAARSFDDLYESVRTQSEAADALWPYDEQTARAILRRAWEATDAPGAEEHVRGFGTSEDPREDARHALTTARSCVVRAAIKHDQRLADSLMREFERGIAERPAEARPSEPTTAREGEPTTTQEGERAAEPAVPERRERSLSPAGWQRLFIARQLAEEGDFKHAAETAAPLTGEGPTLPLLKFILELRAHDARSADALYLRLLGATRADASADSNDVLLLSTPFVSPGLRVSVNPDGSADFVTLGYRNDAELTAALTLPAATRLAFFDTAVSVLLRPRVPRGGKAAGDDDSAALYFAIGRLLPFFEREAAQFAPALHARMGSLAAEIEAGRRDLLKAKMDVSSLTPRNPSDPLNYPLQEVARAGEAKGRDFARLVVVAEAARLALWERARTTMEQIEDGEARRAARLVVAIQQVAVVARSFDDDEPDSFERAVVFVRAADVPPEVRAYGLAQASELAARRGRLERADELLAEASAHAAEVERVEQRAVALALVTRSAARTGGMRVWEMLPAFIRAADEADDLRFGAMLLEFNLGTSDRTVWLTVPAAPISLEEVFAAAAPLDAVRTLTEARSFTDEELRAAALLATARATLEKHARSRSEVLRRGVK